MADWYCFKDKVKMEQGKVKLGFGPMETDVPALVCPKCRVAYIEEDVPEERLLPAAELMEEK